MKGLKGIVSVLLIGTMALSLCACGSKEIAPKDFKSIIKDALDCEKSEISESDGYADYMETYIRYTGEDSEKYSISYIEYEDEVAAKYFFDSELNNIEFKKSHDQINGKVKTSKTSITIDAEVTQGYDGDDEDYYGGTYLAGPYIVSVHTYTGKDKDKDVIDEVIKALGYSKPSRA